METVFQVVFVGLVFGGIYAMVGYSYNIIWSTTTVLNLTNGEFLMIGGLIGYTLSAVLGWPVLGVFMGVLIIVGLISCAQYLGVIRRVLAGAGTGGGNVWLLTTLGTSIVLRQIAVLIWGDLPLKVPEIWQPRMVGGVNASYVMIPVIAVACSIVLHLFYKRTKMGRAMLATAQDPVAASGRGIDPRQVSILAFLLAGGLGALTGLLSAPLTFAYFWIGASVSFKGFIAAALGGLGSNFGALAGGLILGLTESIGTSLVGGGYKDTVAFLVLISVLLVKPQGLTGLPRERRV